ncbi:MAG TPA: lysylphosphatidylglycerol synthase transmembrane domain-containing protein [Anaerolineales bacterium]|nr:lysylphosphatidylglycerol synthase transmembrane domain-containing protein [Anaerolineales bacterium]
MSFPTPRLDRQLIVRGLGTLASLALLVYLLSRQGWSEILSAFQRIPPSSLVAVVALLVISRVAITARWFSLLRTADKSIPFLESLRLTLAGLFAANFLPTTVGGDVVRLAGILKLSSNRVGSAASIVADRLIGLLGMAMALPFGLRDLVLWLQKSSLVAAPLALGVAAGEAPPAMRSWLERARRAVTRIAGELRMWIHHPRALLQALSFTWVHMLCLFAEIWLLLRGMGSTPSAVTIAGLWSLSYFITLVPFSINGLGLREVSVTYIFSELGSVPIENALTLALILRTMDMLISLPGAAFVSSIVADWSADRRREA